MCLVLPVLAGMYGLKTENTLAHFQTASVLSNQLLFSFQGIVYTRMSEDMLKDVCIIKLTKRLDIPAHHLP